MRTRLLAFAILAAAAAPASAQTSMCTGTPVMATPAPSSENRVLSDDAEIAAKVAESKSIITPEQAMARGLVVLQAGSLHHAAVEYRRSPTPASLHERMAEFFYIVDGSADLILGGKLIAPKCLNSSNVSGTGIEGGITHHVKKGTFILVPENTAHYFTNINKTTGMTVLDLHVPTPAADQY